MNRFTLAFATFVAVSTLAPSPAGATTLQYFPQSGNAYLLPATSPTGKVLAYNLASNRQFFVDPARQSAFPPPSPMFFENTTSVIGDNDLTFQGKSSIIPLYKLFPSPVQTLQELTSKFTTRIYVAALSGGERQIALQVAPLDTPEPIVPEPGTLVLACAASLAIQRAARRK